MGQEEKNYEIKYHYLVRGDLERLDTRWYGVVCTAIEGKLMTHPDVYGQPLRESLKGFRKLRVGDYRVVYEIKTNIVRVLIIDHRSIVYRKASARMGK